MIRPSPGPRVGLALLVLAGVLLVASSTGMTSLTGARAVDVVTAPDPTAYLGVAVDHRPTLANGRHEDVRLASLTNGFPVRLASVTVAVVDTERGPPRLLSSVGPAALAVGATAPVTADVVCAGGGDATEEWTVRLEATGPGTAVIATRTVTVGCAGGPPDRGRGPPGEAGPPGRGGGPPPGVPPGPPGGRPR